MRPTVRELNKKLKGAAAAIQNGRRLFAEPEKVVSEINSLDLGDSKEVWELILKLLPEIQPDDYDGRCPPETSYEKAILGKELFPFCWDSHQMKERMYLKFVLDGDTFWYVSLHKSKF